MDSRSKPTPQALPRPDGRATSTRSHNDEWVENLAHRICERRLSAPAIFFFESLRPLNFIASQTLHALGPIASLFIEPSRWEELSAALEDRRTLDRLLEEIEKRERERSLRR
ncbi:MAG: hypothetical protein N2Z21_05210 [Candidatus Sumerlaeaceae bacterium]|nr:hypothetical protein [Candidatus Sumerlaeaceae bacterium]